jgi:hypothetical protein
VLSTKWNEQTKESENGRENSVGEEKGEKNEYRILEGKLEGKKRLGTQR